MLGGCAWMTGSRAHERPDGVAHWMTPSGEFHGATLTRCDLELRCTGSAVRRLLRNGREDFGKALRTARSGQGRRVRVEGRCPRTFHSLGAFLSACETGGPRLRFPYHPAGFMLPAWLEP